MNQSGLLAELKEVHAILDRLIAKVEAVDPQHTVKWPVFVTLDDDLVPITDQYVQKLQRDFPMVDVPTEIRKASAWYDDQPPSKRKKKIHSFLRNWIAKAPKNNRDPWAGLNVG